MESTQSVALFVLFLSNALMVCELPSEETTEARPVLEQQPWTPWLWPTLAVSCLVFPVLWKLFHVIPSCDQDLRYIRETAGDHSCHCRFIVFQDQMGQQLILNRVFRCFSVLFILFIFHDIALISYAMPLRYIRRSHMVSPACDREKQHLLRLLLQLEAKSVSI